MVYVKRGKSTMKQQAYARRVFSGDGENKKQIALDVGFSPHVARSVSTHIENKPGFHNAMSKLAFESNNLALSAIEQFKARGFDGFSNKEMIDALGAISKAWAQFNTAPQEKSLGNTSSTNKLRTVILQQIENQNVMSPGVTDVTTQKPDNESIKGKELDF